MAPGSGQGRPVREPTPTPGARIAEVVDDSDEVAETLQELEAQIRQARERKEIAEKQRELRQLRAEATRIGTTAEVAGPKPLVTPYESSSESSGGSDESVGLEPRKRRHRRSHEEYESGYKLNIKLKDPEPFEGKNVGSYREFVEDVDTYFAIKAPMGGVPDSIRIAYAATRLGGQPKRLWRNNGGHKQCSTMTWKGFLDFLLNCVEDPVNRMLTLHQKYNDSTQGPTQSVASFAGHMRDMTTQMTEDLEEFHRLNLYVKLRPEIRKAMALSGGVPDTEAELIETATRIENVTKKERDHGSGQKRKAEGEKKDHSHKRPKDGKSDTAPTKGRGDHRYEKKERRVAAEDECYNCYEKGHFARDCKKPPKARVGEVAAASKNGSGRPDTTNRNAGDEAASKDGTSTGHSRKETKARRFA